MTLIMSAPLVLESLETGKIKTGTKGVFTDDTSVHFKCSLCETSYMSKTSLNYHIDVAHSVKPTLKCPLCKKIFSHEQSLKRHKRTGLCYIMSDKNRIYPACKLCDKRFRRKDSLTVHKAKVHGLFNIKFDKAEEEFRQDDGSLKCSTCGEQFEGDDAIEDMKTHVVNKCKSAVAVHQCEECGKPFGSIGNLKMHIKMKHRNEYSMHSCKYCDFSSAYKSHLKRHMKRCHPRC